MTDAEAEAPIPWPPDAKRRVIGKDPDAGCILNLGFRLFIASIQKWD